MWVKRWDGEDGVGMGWDSGGGGLLIGRLSRR